MESVHNDVKAEDLAPVIAEGTALLSISTHIGEFLAARRSEREYLVETNAFFDYIQESLAAVREFIQGAVAPSKNPTKVQLNAHLRDLQGLKEVVTLIYRLARWTCDADTLAIPYPIVTYINSLMGELPPSTNSQDAKILAMATDELNFLHHRLDAVRTACEQCSHLPKFPTDLGIIAFPYTERNSILLNSLLFHEIGHFLFQKSRVADEIEASIHELAAKVQSLPSADSLFDRPVLVRAAHARVIGWSQELYCDLIGTTLAGPSYAIAYDRMMALYGKGTDAESRFTDRYPPDLFRRSCIARMLDAHGWLRAIEEVDGDAHNAKFVESIREVASQGWIEAQPRLSSQNSALKINRTGYSYRHSNSGLAGVMVDAFFDSAVPRVFESVQKIKMHLHEYADDFRVHYKEVTSSLLHLMVPRMGSDGAGTSKTIHPVTLLACGSLLLLRDLREIHDLRGTKPEEVTIDSRLWVEDRINRLVMKAVEDALVFNRWSSLK